MEEKDTGSKERNIVETEKRKDVAKTLSDLWSRK